MSINLLPRYSMCREEMPKLICTECNASLSAWRQLLTAQKRTDNSTGPIIIISYN